MRDCIIYIVGNCAFLDFEDIRLILAEVRDMALCSCVEKDILALGKLYVTYECLSS